METSLLQRKHVRAQAIRSNMRCRFVQTKKVTMNKALRKSCVVALLVLVGLVVWSLKEPLTFTFQEERNPTDKSKLYTVQMMTYKRPQALVETITYLMQAPSMDQVLVIWNDVHTPLSRTGLLDFAKRWPKPVVFIQSPSNDVTARWKWRQECRTEAIFNIDDDAYIDVHAIEAAFKVWKEFPDRVVGMYSRAISYDNQQKAWVYALRKRYVKDLSSVHGLVIGKAWFASKTVLKAPSQKNHQLYRRLANFLHDPDKERKGCDDIAWNMYLYEMGFGQPVALAGLPALNVRTSVSSGYSVSSNRNKNGWLRYRNRCIKDLMEFFNSSEPLLHPGFVPAVQVEFSLIKYIVQYLLQLHGTHKISTAYAKEIVSEMDLHHSHSIDQIELFGEER